MLLRFCVERGKGGEERGNGKVRWFEVEKKKGKNNLRDGINLAFFSSPGLLLS